MHTRTYSMHSSRLRGQFAITTVQVNFERTQKNSDSVQTEPNGPVIHVHIQACIPVACAASLQ